MHDTTHIEYNNVAIGYCINGVLFLTLIIFIGMLGFMLIEDYDPADALYMTVITLSTVGFGEVAPLHLSGKIFVIFLILFGESFNFDKRSGRYIRSQPTGYVTVKTSSDTESGPYMEIGNCSLR